MATPRPTLVAALSLLAVIPLAAFALGRGGQLDGVAAALSAGSVLVIATSVYWLFDGRLARGAVE